MQLCYQVDANQAKKELKDNKALKKGITFAMDYNSEKSIKETKESVFVAGGSMNFDQEQISTIVEGDDNKEATIYIETLGWMH